MSHTMIRRIRIATSGVAQDYRLSLVPLVIGSLGYKIEWTSISNADLLVLGPFHNPHARNRWVPRPLRASHERIVKKLQGNHHPLRLFQTGENLRHDHFPHDYALSFDLAVNDPKHHRFPYWMEMVDWSHEGITGNINPRFGSLLKLERLQQPLGNGFLKKPLKAALFASHIREPRATLMRALQQHIQVEGFGSAFDSSVIHHSSSGFIKRDVLMNFAFNLCPENSMYPGYYTEKIPESFMADCLPLAWTDSNVIADFNPEAFLNLAPMSALGFRDLPSELLRPERLERYAQQPLLLQKPSLQPIINLVKHLASDACS